MGVLSLVRSWSCWRRSLSGLSLHLIHEGLVGGCEVGKHSLIGGCGRCQIRQCACRFCGKVHGIGLMVASGLGGALGDAQVGLSFGEVSFEVGPGFVGWGFAAPVLTSIIVESSFEDQVVGVGEDLLVRVGLLAGHCESVGVLDLLV